MPFLERRNHNGGALTHGNRSPDLERILATSQDEYIASDSAKNIRLRSSTASSERMICANPDCTGSWKLPWKNRRRPIFEGQWGCSNRCLQAIVRKALRRERADGAPLLHANEPYRHRVPLGLVMLAQGWITHPQLRRALDAQRAHGEGRIGDWLVQECGVDTEQVTRGLSVQWSCPVLPLDGFAPAAMALTMPRFFVEELGLLPLRVAGSRILYLAFKERLHASAAFAVEQMSGLKVESGIIDGAQFDAARSRLFASQFVTTKQEAVIDADTLAAKISAVLEQSQPVGAYIVRIHQSYWLRLWLETGAYSGIGSLPASGEDVTDTIFTIGSHG